ncbi:unnamed protein product [marine sediment metagenome]|uniref:Uncharacterized protein n=1 Tax=marine sediment metagenome TaxID=412755 RepID=X1C8V7_9ZZZZ
MNIKESITHLVNVIYEEYSSLIQILKTHETDIQGLGDELKKDRVEMRDLLNNLEIKRFIEVDRVRKTYKVRSGLKYLA